MDKKVIKEEIEEMIKETPLNEELLAAEELENVEGGECRLFQCFSGAEKCYENA